MPATPAVWVTFTVPHTLGSGAAGDLLESVSETGRPAAPPPRCGLCVRQQSVDSPTVYETMAGGRSVLKPLRDESETHAPDPLIHP